MISDAGGNMQQVELKSIPIYVVGSISFYRHENVKDLNKAYELILKMDLNFKEKPMAEIMVRQSTSIHNDLKWSYLLFVLVEAKKIVAV